MRTVLEDTIKEAFNFYTGGQFTPHLRNPTWFTLISWMEQNNVDPYEFCYFCITELDPTLPVNLLMLQRKYYICSNTVLEQFLKYRPLRKAKFESIVKFQKQHANNLRNIYPSWDSLLSDKNADLAEYVRVDLAIEFCETTECKERIIEQCLTNLVYLMKGNPELLEVCPNLSSLLRK